MGVTDVLSRKTGVIVGDDVLALFKYAREHKFALPAVVCLITQSPACLVDTLLLRRALGQNKLRCTNESSLP